jgi:hypothetical protein
LRLSLRTTIKLDMPRFVLLHHECPPGFSKSSHWDFMLELGDVLQTWELRVLPSSWQQALGCSSESATLSVTVTQLPDHRLEYLTFEGPISKVRGSVTRVAEGIFQTLKVKEKKLVISLDGETITGIVTLSQMAEGETWLLSTNG